MKLFLFILSLFLVLRVSAQVNQTDEQGRKQGYWEKKYSNGNIQYKGTFIDDLPTGEFMHYDYRLNLIARVNHVSADSATAKIYHTNGKVSGEGTYINQEKEGTWNFFDDRGKLSAVENFHQGIRNGQSETFYLNGQVSRRTTYIQGIENGTRTDYYDSGKKSFEGNVVDGVFDGLVVYFHSNGKKRLEGHYRNAVRDGRWIVYDENGLPQKRLDYKLGVLPPEQRPKFSSDSTDTSGSY
jgi:antitoxin component YwqK of YwqJK toxin-antitoxin module